MTGFEAATPDSAECRTGGGGASCFGLPFLGVFVFALLSVTVLPPENVEGDPVTGMNCMLPFGFIGFGLVFGRSGTRIDASGEIVRWWGLLSWKISETHELVDGGDKIVLAREVRGSGKSRRVYFPLYIEGPELERVEIHAQPTLYVKARTSAECVAQVLNLPLHDETGDEITIRQPDDLDKPLAEGGLAEVGELPPEPARLRGTYSWEGSTWVATLPGWGTTPTEWVALVLFGAFAMVPWLVVLSGGVSAIPCAMFFMIPVAPGLWRLAPEHVAVGPEGLTHWRVHPWFTSQIALAHLEELVIIAPQDRPLLTARSNTAELKFGRGLTREELEWFRGQAKQHLALVWEMDRP